MNYESFGPIENELLVCVPGLLGGPEDFARLIPDWITRFHVVVLDPNQERRQQGLNQLTAESMQEISFNSTSDEIAQIVKDQQRKKVFLLGISLGGKIVYDFALKYSQLFAGAVISDVGPGSFENSALYVLVDQIVQDVNLSLPWPEMKLDLKARIQDRNMRSLIQTQLSYPHQKPPAVWKTGMRNFRTMLERQAIADQFEGLAKVDEQLRAKNAFIEVLHASQYSGIGEACLPAIRQLVAIRLHPVANASHFLHITHKELITQYVLALGTSSESAF